ncbi:MAG: hypothetical protein WBF87_12890 [Mesorhizobium sp.]
MLKISSGRWDRSHLQFNPVGQHDDYGKWTWFILSERVWRPAEAQKEKGRTVAGAALYFDFAVV